jgi:glutamate synthase domain-containing protein 3
MATVKNHVITIDTTGLGYRELNAQLRDCVSNGMQKVLLHNVCGQRYIGTGLNIPIEIEIHGTPGNDLGAFMDGPNISVYGNAQDCCGNTMNNGKIVVYGHAGDVIGLSARGGKIFIREDVGYRAGIHMKQYQDKKPVLVIGGTSQDFLGEYMAGGVLIMLGLTLPLGKNHKARFIGTGMHGGVIYLRGNVEAYQLGKEVGVAELEGHDLSILRQEVHEYAELFGYDENEILKTEFTKLVPRWLRPYGRLYAY